MNDVRRSSFRAVLILFAAEAVITGLLYARLPDIKISNGLSSAAFGLVLLGIPVGNVVGFVLAPFLIGRLGLTAVSWLAVATLGIASLGPGIATTMPVLVGTFILLGLCLSHTEVSQNSMAGYVERTTERRVMSRCHGGWSIGSIIGLLAGGFMSQAEISLFAQSVGVAVMGLMAALSLSRLLPHVPGRSVVAKIALPTIRNRFPPVALLLLCILPLGTLALEGIVRDWGAIFLRDELGAAPFASTLLFVVVSTAMAAVRLLGDAALDRLGERTVVGGSIVCASAGMLVIAGAPSLNLVLVGAGVTGVGVALVYPIALSIAARRSDRPERDVATMSLICFVTLMASPVAVGLVSEAAGLRVAFAAFALLSLFALALLRITQEEV